jgi:hypothetical protein
MKRWQLFMGMTLFMVVIICHSDAANPPNNAGASSSSGSESDKGSTDTATVAREMTLNYYDLLEVARDATPGIVHYHCIVISD